jgi:hypothetical protein
MDEADVERIKAIASDRDLSLGTLVRDAVLGASEPSSSVLDRLEGLEEWMGALADPQWIERVNTALMSMDARLRGLEGSSDSEAVADLDRRVSELEERARQTYR